MSTYERDPTTGNLKLISGVSWSYIKDKIKTILHIDDNTIDDITDVYGAKNLFNTKGNYTLFSNGSYVDPTFNSDGTIQFGSFSGGNYYSCSFTDNISFNESIDLIFTSGLTDASDSTAYIEVLYNPSSILESVRIYNDPVLIEDVWMIDQIDLVSIDGQSRLFKPMLRTAGIKSDKYVPHAMTNRELTADLNTLKSNVAKKIDLTNISITGTTNNTGAIITSGTFFYLNDLLVRAKADIASGATLTSSNYESVTAGGLNKLKNDLATWTEFTPTFSSSITDLQIRQRDCYYNPITKEIILNIVIWSNSGLIPVNNNTICTVPTGYKPTSDRSLGMALVTPKTQSNFSPPSMEACMVDTNGVVRLGNFIYGNIATKFFALHAVYKI